MIEIIPKKNLNAAEIKVLREISSLSISQIKKASSEGTSIRCFEAFVNNWEEQRVELVSIYHLYLEDDAPFTVVNLDSGTQELLTPEQLYSTFKFWRSIELKEQKNSDLEMGYINNPNEFLPHDEDWV